MSASIFRTPIFTELAIFGSSDCILFPKSLLCSQFPVKIPSSPSFSINYAPYIHSNRILDSRRRFAANELGHNSDNELLEAQEAVSEILQEAGASEEESVEIAAKSPKYGKMLIDNVRELDEASLWNSWKIEKEDIGGLSFKEKVFYMAKEKRDKGILPFLESIGLNPSSLMHVARYLSSETLLQLIEKVKYVKEMFFSGSDQDGFVGKNARHMMMHLSIFIDDDIQQTLSFFEKMEARRGGLNMLNSGDAAFPYLIESFPRLLLQSVEHHFRPLVEYLEGVGVAKGCIRNIVLLFPPIVFYDVEKDIRQRLKAFEMAGVGEKDIGKMLVKYPWILSTSIEENYSEILSFFDTERAPKASVERAIRSWPHILGCSTSKMKSVLEEFAALGVKHKKFGQIIASSPQLLLQKPKDFREVVSFMEGLGFDEESIGRILCRCPEIFAADVEKTLQKKLLFLSEFGISRTQLPRVIKKYPELLVSDFESTLLPRMSYLMKIGLSKREVASMVNRFSPLLGYSIEEVLKPKLEFLLFTMGKPVRDVVEYPRYFSYSLEKKIKPRYWVLKSRNVECSLKDMLGKNDEDFATDYMGVGRMLIPPSFGDN